MINTLLSGVVVLVALLIPTIVYMALIGIYENCKKKGGRK